MTAFRSTSTAPPQRAALLPEGFWWFYVIGPPLFVALFDIDLLLEDPSHLGSSLVINYIHTFAVCGTLHAAYTFLLPRWFAAMPDRAVLRFVVHALTILILVPAATLAAKPIIQPICPNHNKGLTELLVLSYVVSAVVLLAAMTYQQLRRRAHEIERLAVAERQAALSAELRALQSKTNPHFLFNSLNAVASLIPKDPERAEETVERLAEVLRYSLDRARRSTVRIEEELKIVEEYLAIEAVRFGKRLQYDVSCGPESRDLKIPPMLLEPLVENAVLHGIGSNREGGTISVRVSRTAATVRLEVTDDGPGLGASTHAGSSTSLRDLRERLLLIYGTDELLDFEDADGERRGCRAVLTLPIWK